MKSQDVFLSLLLHCGAEGSKGHAVCHSAALTLYRGSLVEMQERGLGTAVSEALALGRRKYSSTWSVRASSRGGWALRAFYRLTPGCGGWWYGPQRWRPLWYWSRSVLLARCPDGLCRTRWLSVERFRRVGLFPGGGGGSQMCRIQYLRCISSVL